MTVNSGRAAQLTSDARLSDADIDLLIAGAFNVASAAGCAIAVTIIGSEGDQVATRSMSGAGMKASSSATRSALHAFEFGDPNERLFERAAKRAITHAERVAASGMRAAGGPHGSALIRNKKMVGSIGVGGTGPTDGALILEAVLARWKSEPSVEGTR